MALEVLVPCPHGCSDQIDCFEPGCEGGYRVNIELSPLGHMHEAVPECPGRSFHEYEQVTDVEGEARCVHCGIEWYWASDVLRLRRTNA